ncbi:MAG: hypothetical protein U0165_05980 [Polyangiaceae bacterium]
MSWPGAVERLRCTGWLGRRDQNVLRDPIHPVTFPMFSKITVKGGAKHELYGWLTTEASPSGEVGWNFGEFLVNRDGSEIAGRFKSGVDPLSAELSSAIEALL